MSDRDMALLYIITLLTQTRLPNFSKDNIMAAAV